MFFYVFCAAINVFLPLLQGSTDGNLPSRVGQLEQKLSDSGDVTTRINTLQSTIDDLVTRVSYVTNHW